MMELKNYTFCYDYKESFEKVIFKNVNFKIDKNKTLLLGPSGCGKSTLFKSLIGHIKPSKGKIFANNEVSLVLQNVNNQIICNSIYDEINLGYKKKKKKDISKLLIQKYFEMFDIDFNLEANPLNLSGGQKKMVVLISIICLEPDFLILDEPFVGLDQKRRKSVISFLKDTKIPFLLSSHDIEDSYQIYDEIITIKNNDIKKINLSEAIDAKIIAKPKGV